MVFLRVISYVLGISITLYGFMGGVLNLGPDGPVDDLWVRPLALFVCLVGISYLFPFKRYVDNPNFTTAMVAFQLSPIIALSIAFTHSIATGTVQEIGYIFQIWIVCSIVTCITPATLWIYRSQRGRSADNYAQKLQRSSC